MERVNFNSTTTSTVQRLSDLRTTDNGPIKVVVEPTHLLAVDLETYATRAIVEVDPRMPPSLIKSRAGPTADGKYLVAFNKWSVHRFFPTGPLLPQNFQRLDISAGGASMPVIYGAPRHRVLI